MPRIDAREALDRIRRLRAAIRLQTPVALTRGIKAGHEQHMQEVEGLRRIFARERYIRDGVEVQLGQIRESWRKRKAALGQMTELGHFTGTLDNAIAHVWASPITQTGWRFDLRLAGRLMARYRTLGKRLRGGKRGPRAVIAQPLRDDDGKYLDYYVEEKAPGLGELPPGAIEREDAAVREKSREEFAAILAGYGFDAVGGVVTVPISLRVRE